MSYLDMIEKLINEKNEDSQPKLLIPSIEQIPNMTLSEFSKRSMAIEIYSEILQRNIWFCSNDEMVRQIKTDVPDAICFTSDELKHLLNLNPSPEDIKRINLIKGESDTSRVINALVRVPSNLN
jgi:hypothetical protein